MNVGYLFKYQALNLYICNIFCETSCLRQHEHNSRTSGICQKQLFQENLVAAMEIMMFFPPVTV